MNQSSTVSARLLPALLPTGIASAELRQPAGGRSLSPEEARCVAGASLKRRQDFATGRLCAAQALAEFDIANFPLLVADDRSPRWPTGLVGSITHTTGFYGAAVAARGDFAGVGIDAEPISHTMWQLARKICTPDEFKWLFQVAEPRRPAFATLIFSAKECFYKSQFGMTGERLEFTDVRVGIGDGCFEVLPCRPLSAFSGRSALVVGRFRIEQDLVLTGLALPAR